MSVKNTLFKVPRLGSNWEKLNERSLYGWLPANLTGDTVMVWVINEASDAEALKATTEAIAVILLINIRRYTGTGLKMVYRLVGHFLFTFGTCLSKKLSRMKC